MKYFKIFIVLILVLLNFIFISTSLKNTIIVNNDFDEDINHLSYDSITNQQSIEKYNKFNFNNHDDISNSNNNLASSNSNSNSNSNNNNNNNDNNDSSNSTPIPLNNLNQVTALLTFSGGKVLCNSSALCPSGYDYLNHYACSYYIIPGIPRGNWGNGIKQFYDPISSDLNVTIEAVSFIITGTVGCSNNSSPTTMSFLIQDVLIASNTTNSVTDCSCGTCVLKYEIAPQSYSGLGYKRNGTNKFQLQVADNNGICVSEIFVNLFYSVIQPPTLPPTNSPTPTPTSNPNKNLSPQEKKYIILASAITGGLLLVIFTFVFIRKFLRKRKKDGYIRIKDGKDIDIHQIKLGKRIGKGNFGEVFLGTWRGSKVAIKKLPVHNINENILKEFHREIELMKNLRHPNVIQFLGSCTIPPDICICTEYMERGSLYSILHDPSTTLSWELVKRMMIDAAKGIIYLHGSNPVILHRDLKSHNLLVEEDFKVKVADFGLSAIEQKAQTMTSCGTPSWTSPEILRGQRYTDKADVYSFGIILWECATRQDPYFGIPPFQVIFAVGREGLRPPIPKVGPPQYIQLIIDCLNENPNKRPSMEQVLERLEVIDTNPSVYQDIIIPDQQEPPSTVYNFV